MRLLLQVLFCVLIPASCLGQKTEEAHQLGMKGVALVDQGEYAEGIKLLSKAQHAHPAAYDYPFEIARALMLSGKHGKAEKYLFPLQYHKEASADLYMMLAACYDSIKKPNRVEEAYRYAIQKFPNEGKLYHGLASFYVSRDSVAEGLGICELGLERDPAYADNYFLASRIMDAKGNKLWAWWYGEVFLNLSDNAVMKRGLAKQVARNAEEVVSGKWKPEVMRLDQAVAKSLKPCALDTSNNMILRQSALRTCFARNFKGKDPYTALLREMDRQDIMELYVAHLFGEVDREVLLPWLAERGPEYERFKQWFYWNGLKIDSPFTRHTTISP